MNDQQIVIAVLFTTLLLLLLVAGIFISIYIAGKQRVQQELGYEKELRKVENEVSENMMERFAQELHDNVGHILTCMRITIENKKIDQPLLEEAFRPVEHYLDEASEQLRLLSRSLNTDYVLNIGLHAAIQLEIDRINHLRKNFVHWQVSGEEVRMHKNRELMAFRIFQEMIHNSIKHSKAKNLYVSLTTAKRFELQVCDDGKGFSTDEMLASPKASGLKNMMKRAKMAGMDCTIESTPGKGCTYILQEHLNSSI